MGKTEWKFVVKTTQVYFVDLDTSDKEEALEKVSAMIEKGELNLNNDDEIYIDEDIFQV